MRKRCKGFSLIEAAIVLGVVGLVIGGIWVAAADVSENMKLNKAVAGVLVILNNVNRLYPPDVNAIPSNMDAQIAPITIQGADGYSFDPTLGVTSPWGGLVSYGGSLPAKQFAITLQGLTSSQCMRLVSAISSRYVNASVPDLDHILVLTSAWATTATFTTYPVIPTAAQCPTNAKVSFWFRRLN